MLVAAPVTRYRTWESLLFDCRTVRDVSSGGRFLRATCLGGCARVSRKRRSCTRKVTALCTVPGMRRELVSWTVLVDISLSTHSKQLIRMILSAGPIRRTIGAESGIRLMLERSSSGCVDNKPCPCEGPLQHETMILRVHRMKMCSPLGCQSRREPE